ncbi:MGMT family protein [Lysinibacillus sp. RS11]|uniref:MGMT family protein n=1 Tax=Lysinibacillus sp. RS11 TaxID=3242682 RepID=UPI0035C6BD73
MTFRITFNQTSDFQQAVWSTLSRIPYAKTYSYKDLALEIGKEKAVRVVGSASGLRRKEWLL